MENIKGMYDAVRTHLEDVHIYQAGAQAQQRINRVWSSLIGETARRDPTIVMAKKEGWKMRFASDPKRAKEFLARTYGAEGDLDVGYMKTKYVDGHKLLEIAAKEYKLSDKLMGNVRNCKRAGERIDEIMHDAREYYKTLDEVRSIDISKGSGLEAGVAGAGGVIGAGVGGAVGGVVGAGIGVAVGKGLHVLANPVSTAKTLSMVHRVVRGSHSSIDKSVSEYVKGVKERTKPRMVAPAASNILASLRYEPQVRKRESETRSEAMSNRIRELNAQVADLQSFARNLERSVGVFARELPNAVASMGEIATRALHFLQSKSPKEKLGRMIRTRGIKPSNMEITKFERYAAAVENPLSVLEDLKRGTVNHEEVEALQVVYPRIYEEIVSALVEHIPELEDKLSYPERVQLSILFGVPVERLAEQGAIAKLQTSMSIDPDQEMRERVNEIRRVRTSGVAKMKAYKNLGTKLSRVENA
jgi:hypothetical protein